MKTRFLISLFCLTTFWFTSAQTNVALGKSTEQSSTYEIALSSRAVDGNNNGLWVNSSVTHTQSQNNPWWKVDLGSVYNISQITIYGRSDCCLDRLIGTKIYAGNIDSTNLSDYNLIAPPLNGNAIQQINNLNVDARFIMVYSEGSNRILSLAEFEVYGIESTSLWNQFETSIHYDLGNVGIGTITPDEKLAVNGNIHTKEVRVDLIGWSDFVFESDYKLPTLKEVETHIKEKGHLKDIPSAEEVAENGILLGDMNAKLLQKIEELALYTIEQEKKLESQEKTNQELKDRLLKIEQLLFDKKSDN